MALRKKFLSMLAAAALVLACAPVQPAAAQATAQAVVLTTCGTNPTTYTAGQARPITQDTTGTLCSQSGGGGGGGNVNVVSQSAGLAQDTSLTQIQQTHSSVAGNGSYILDPSTGLPVTYTAPTNTNTAQVNAVTVLTGTGAVGTGAQRIAVGTDTATIAGSAPSTVLNNNTAQVNGVTTLTGTGAVGTGAQRIAVGTDTATIAGSAPGTAGTPSANVVTVQGATSMTPILTQSTPGTANGLSFATLTAANSTNATNLKASAGQLYHVTAYNNSATLAWISFYNNAGTPTCGTSIVYQVMIPANSTSGAGAIDDVPSGLTFSTGIAYCITTGIAGTGSVAATSYVANFAYK